MSESHINKSHPHRGHKLSDDTKEKISSSHKNKHRIYYSRGNKGMHWYNNGIVQMQAFECPDGFVKGMLS